ncbi:MAG TPA: TadE family protein [Bryobacteraceae bacterium]|nr:TadE family protein [Bryobacteraceae bacterium]
MPRLRRGRRGGQSAVEFALLAPWYIFLFIGAFDWGFFAHGLISTENAARVAAMYNAWKNTPTDQNTACRYAWMELQTAVNVPSTLPSCSALPIIVTATQVNGPDGAGAAQVTVEYQTQQLIPIPGLINGQYTFYRVVKMRI